MTVSTMFRNKINLQKAAHVKKRQKRREESIVRLKHKFQ